MYKVHTIPRQGAWFEGFYLKHRGPEGGIAFIPAVHREGNRVCTASLQVITDNASYVLDYPFEDFCVQHNGQMLRVGENSFSSAGACLHLDRDGLEISGELHYGPFTPLRGDIMGPFRLVEPLMQCYHGVISQRHGLSGQLTVNGRTMDFQGGTGYIETDRGRSFPTDYLWTQCNWDNNGIMLSVAEIPFLWGRFKGCICTVLYGNQEFRLATYQGARIQNYGSRGAEICQGSTRLIVELLSATACPLRAPRQGGMSRIIKESLSACVRYRFWYKNKLFFDHVDRAASYEYADEKANAPSQWMDEKSPGTK